MTSLATPEGQKSGKLFHNKNENDIDPPESNIGRSLPSNTLEYTLPFWK